VPPADGEPLTKTLLLDGNQVSYKLCGRCRRWRAWEKAHATEEHRTRAELSDASTTQAPNNQGNVGSVSNAGNLGLSFGLGGLFVGSTDLSTDHPLLGNTDIFLQAISESSTEVFYDDYSVTDDSVQTEPTALGSMSSDSSPDESQASTVSETLRSLIAGLHSLANATRSDITHRVNRAFGRAHDDSYNPNDPLDLLNWLSEADGSNPNEADEFSTDTMPSLHMQYPDNPNEADDSSTDTMPELLLGNVHLF
jgi:hypothetical protein